MRRVDDEQEPCARHRSGRRHHKRIFGQQTCVGRAKIKRVVADSSIAAFAVCVLQPRGTGSILMQVDKHTLSTEPGC